MPSPHRGHSYSFELLFLIVGREKTRTSISRLSEFMVRQNAPSMYVRSGASSPPLTTNEDQLPDAILVIDNGSFSWV
jgi:Na+-translocating ferredoxin:NAD+ oxidoreductase RnfA subunit